MKSKPILQPLRHLSGVCEILGLGRVRENPNMGIEAWVEVLVQQDIFGRLAEPQTVTKWIGVGQMNLLASGYRFENGRQIKSAPRMRFDGMLSPIKNPERETLGTGIFAGTGANAPTAKLDKAPGWLLRHEGGWLDGSDDVDKPPRVVFLPATELIRAVFGSSSDLLKQLIDGRRDPTMTRSRYSVDRSRCSVDPEGRVSLSVSRKINAEDAHVLAALFADRSERLLRFHDMIHQRLHTDPAFRTNVGAFIQAAWPWPQGVGMAFAGRWLRRTPASAGQKRFVVTQIEKILFPSPPTAIEVKYPNETEAARGLPQPSGRTIATVGGVRPLRSDRTPGSGRTQESIDTQAAIFPFANAFEIAWSPGETYAGRKDVGLRSDPVAGERFLSTDDARSGGDAATGQAKLIGKRELRHDYEPDREGNAARQKTWEALAILAERKHWTVTYWEERTRGVRVVPYDPADVDAEAPLVATIKTDAGFKAIADFGSAIGDPASIGVERQSRRSSESLLAADVYGHARSNNWKWLSRKMRNSSHGSSRIEGHSRSRRCWKDSEYYANKLFEWLA